MRWTLLLLSFAAGIGLGFPASKPWHNRACNRELTGMRHQRDGWMHLAGELERERDDAQREAFK